MSKIIGEFFYKIVVENNNGQLEMIKQNLNGAAAGIATIDGLYEVVALLATMRTTEAGKAHIKSLDDLIQKLLIIWQEMNDILVDERAIESGEDILRKLFGDEAV